MADMLDLIQGLGNAVFTAKNTPFLDAADNAKNVIQIPAFLGMNLNTSTEKKVARYQKAGKVVTAKSAIASQETIATLTFEQINEDHLAFFMNSQWQTSSNVIWPKLSDAMTVPSGTPEITDTDITAGNAADVFVFMDSNAAGTRSGPLIPTNEAAPASGEFKVDGATNKITFHADQIGATIRYKVPITYSSARTLLYEQNVTSFGSVTWEGDVLLASGREAKMRVHDMSPSSTPSFEFADGLISVELEFDCNTPSDKDFPFEFLTDLTA